MFLDSFLKSEKVYSAKIERVETPTVGGVPGAKQYFEVKTVDVLFWRGSMAEAFISAKFRDVVSAVALVSPVDISVSEIPEGGRLTLYLGKDVDPMYSIVIADDVAEQGDVIVIQLQEFKK